MKPKLSVWLIALLWPLQTWAIGYVYTGVKPRVNWTPIWMSSSRFRILDFEFFPTHLCRGFVAMALQDPLFII